MLIHSKDFVTNLDERCIQPNAVDLRVQNIFTIDTGYGECVTITEDAPKKFFSRVESTHDTWHIKGRSSVDFITQHEVEIPEGMCGWLIIRSTFARNGCLLGNGLYDSGYKGVIGGVLHNLTDGDLIIARGTRIAQFVMAKAESSHLYNGYYNTTNGVSVPQ